MEQPFTELAAAGEKITQYYAPTPLRPLYAGSPFRQFDVTCLKCGTYDLRLAAQMDEKAGEMALVLVYNKCRQREILSVR
jgi:hypothetical protein